MKVLQEITQWDWPNHTYFVSDNRERILAYVKMGTDQIKEFKKPYPFNIRGRKFKEIDNQWNFSTEKDVREIPAGHNWTVRGSGGDEYVVNLNNNIYTCACAGFKFRNRCKHVEQIKQLEISPV
jgi:hypothetical protein